MLINAYIKDKLQKLFSFKLLLLIKVGMYQFVSECKITNYYRKQKYTCVVILLYVYSSCGVTLYINM